MVKPTTKKLDIRAQIVKYLSMKKTFLRGLEFYITNVCNLNCENCNRLNNYKFSGHQKWAELEDSCKEWSSKLDLGFMRLMGGEPTLNPEFKDWVYGLRRLWPAIDFFIHTNGSRISKIDNLYQTLLDNKAQLNITAHNRGRFNTIVSSIKDILVSPITEKLHADFSNWPLAYNDIKDPSWPTVVDVSDFANLPLHIQEECTNLHNIDPINWAKNSNGITITDANGVCVQIEYAESFFTAPLKYSGDHQFQVYNSVPEIAHTVCKSKNCTHFMNGKIYKCHHVALLPEFQKQFLVNISSEDQNLLDSYSPLNLSATQDEIENFITNLPNVIPQCKVCPSTLEENELHSTTIKPKINKIWGLKSNYTQ